MEGLLSTGPTPSSFIQYRVANSVRYSLQGQGWECSIDKMYFQGALMPCKSEYYSVHYSALYSALLGTS